MIEIVEFLHEDGTSPYATWFDKLSPDVAAKVAVASVRMSLGNLSNVKWFSGIGEFKIDYGAGWRIYLGRDGDTLIVLLGGGSKSRQQRDIDDALALWDQYKRRKRETREKTKKGAP
jgi:putative addiction module killer protein